MSTSLAESFETGPYAFHNPRRVVLPTKRACFACSGGLEKSRHPEPEGFLAIEADCVQDGIPRHFHVRCWGSGKTGAIYRYERQRRAEGWQRDRDIRRRQEGA